MKSRPSRFALRIRASLGAITRRRSELSYVSGARASALFGGASVGSTRSVAAGVAALVLAGCSFAVAAPAQADEPASSGSLFTLSCSPGIADQLYSVSATDALVAKVGTGTGTLASCAGPGSYNPVDGRIYYIDASISGGLGEDVGDGLRSVDPGTGVSRSVFADFTWRDAPAKVDSIAIDDRGHIFAISDTISQSDKSPADEELDSDPSQLFSVDPTTGALTLIGDVTPEGRQFFSLAYEAEDENGDGGTLVAFTKDATAFTIDPVTGAGREGATFRFPRGTTPAITGLALDPVNARVYFINITEGEDRVDATLWSIDAVGIHSSGILHFADEMSTETAAGFYALAMVPAAVAPVPGPVPAADPTSPKLAETGVDRPFTVGLSGASALAVLLGGGALAAARMRRRAA